MPRWLAHLLVVVGWLLTPVLAGSLVLVRRQALKESEPFWSPPTRRVTQAMLPPLVAGTIVSRDVERLGDASGARRIRIADIADFGAAAGPVGARENVRLSADDRYHTTNHRPVVVDDD